MRSIALQINASHLECLPMAFKGDAHMKHPHCLLFWFIVAKYEYHEPCCLSSSEGWLLISLRSSHESQSHTVNFSYTIETDNIGADKLKLLLTFGKNASGIFT